MMDQDMNLDIDMTSRLLGGAGGGKTLELDYTIFAMAVMTMGLLLIVEVIRHKLDQMTKGSDFFESVMKTVYHELATLGIVEATVFLIHQNFEVNLEKERIFADVHFTLFFVAIINALMGCITYILAMQVAESRWVKMEALDTNHYVAIRSQFHQVQKQMKKIESKNKRFRKYNNNHQTPTTDDARTDTFAANHEAPTNHEPSNLKQKVSLIEIWGAHDMFKGVLRKKYANLLVQLRFHDLRVHFIEKHSLPAKFRVSDYLKLAMNDVFKEFVHISTRTWLALMGCTNLIYFAMGVVTSITTTTTSSSSSSSYNSNFNRENKIVSYSLSWIYISCCIIFVLVSYLIFVKMCNIFNTIIERDSWVKVVEKSLRGFGIHSDGSIAGDDNVSIVSYTKDRQTDQFWFGKPDLIITFAQLMQFFYSVGFAILLIFRKNVKSGNVFYWWGWYAIVPVVCFVIFIWFWSIIIPVYTQCTSLGELVSERHLIEIDAFSKLEEERGRRQEQIDYVLAEKEVTENMNRRMATTEKRRIRRRTMSKPMSYETEAKTNEHLEQISDFVKRPTKDVIRKWTRTLSLPDTDSSQDSFFSPENNAQQKTDDKAAKAKESEKNKRKKEKIPFEVKARRFLLTPIYRHVSTVFGTMIAFYFIALRIQMFLIGTCQMKDLDIIWYFELNLTNVFWILLGWLCLFIIESSIVIILFLLEEDKEHFDMVIAGLMDILISCICIVTFVLAERNRCCDCSSNDNLSFNSKNSIDSTRASSNYGDEYPQPDCSAIDSECCPAFGSRLCGGMGVIEPFTSIIILRLFRFFLAYHYFRRNKGSITSSTEVEAKKGKNELVISSNHDDSSHFNDLSHTTGTMAELWILALTKYTKVVEKHGIFSSHLLEMMLGIDPLPDGCEQVLMEKEKERLNSPRRIVTFDRPYSQLIRSMRRCNCKWYPLLGDEWHMVDVVLTEHELVWFDAKVDTSEVNSSEIEAIQIVKDQMIAGGGGGKKLWLQDVALGRTVLGRLSLSDLEQAKVQRLVTQSRSSSEKDDQAITNNNECDIENGKQYSRSLRSEYWSPSTTSNKNTDVNAGSTNDDAVDIGTSSPLFLKEDQKVGATEKDWFDNQQMGHQERLKLHSNHGTLYLWFIADINSGIEKEGFKDNENDDKNNLALSWCKTIVHLRGESRLKQKLPHLGTKYEWRDFVETIYSNNGEDEDVDSQKGLKMSILQRMFSRNF